MENTNKTISEVLYNKFTSYLANNKLSKVTTPIFRLVLSLVLSFALSNIREAVETLKFALLFHDFLIPKFIFSYIMVRNHKFIIESFKNVFTIPVKKIEVDTFLGMEIQEIVDYIMETKGFKREEFAKVFSIGRDTSEKLGKKLDEINLFVRGENNARVLNAEFSPDEIFSIFSGKESIEEISYVRRDLGNGNYQVISPTGFETRRIPIST